MYSRIATEARDTLLAAHQRLTAEERLNAFLAHSRLMVELKRAGQGLKPRAGEPGG